VVTRLLPLVRRAFYSFPALVTHVLIGVAAALGAVLLLLLGLLLGLRRRSSAATAAVEQRLDALAADLGGALERAEERSRQSHVLGEISASIDLDEVVRRTLAAVAGLPGVDAALVRVDAGAGEPLVAALGLDGDDDTARQAVVGAPEGHPARAVELIYRYAEDESTGATVRRALEVPLEDDAGPVGTLAVFSRDLDRTFGDEDLARLEEVARRAAPAIENARRFREARKLADLDALTDLHNRRYFHETLGREVVRAQRYGRRLALIVFDVDDFKDVNDRIGHLAGDAVLAEAAARVRDVVRTADVPCRVGGDEFAVIMPESRLEDAEQLFNRVQAAIAGRPLALAGRLRISGGLAELRADDDPLTLFERADRALYEAKEAGKGRSRAATA
jgi:two-component system, cell cycle response regulator